MASSCGSGGCDGVSSMMDRPWARSVASFAFCILCMSWVP